MPNIPEDCLSTARELLDQLSPTNRQSNSDNQVIYRGQADAKWKLRPTYLRQESLQFLREFLPEPLTCEDLAWREFDDLRHFVRCCDEAGVKVPGDSIQMRDSVLSDMNFRNYHEFPSAWPSDEFLEIMAFGRLHGLATRLLDWSINPYVAAYFAASEALFSQDDWRPDQRIAVFQLDFGPVDKTYIGKVRLVKIRGSISPNVVAQKGVFTLHPSVGNKGEMVEVKSLENYLPIRPASPIKVFTIPVSQARELYELCDSFGINAASLFHVPEGAVRAFREVQMHALARKNDQR